MEQIRENIKHSPQQELHIATGSSRTAKTWKNISLTWQELVERLRKPTITQETVAEYSKMSRAEKGQTKDVGGFVGGWLKQGRRRNENVQSRSLVALDADSPSKDFLDKLDILADYAYVLYSTHSHTKKAAKYRIIIPTDRLMLPDEYEPVARYLANQLGMSNFDDTTYQNVRMMFWPSHSSDAEYIYKFNDGEFLNVDEILDTYPDWKDSSFWPESETHTVRRQHEAKKQGDPLSKKGLIGAFCRTYDIRQAIATFLEGVYAEGSTDDRYTYVGGSTANGLVIYDYVFAYSHHGTDPVGDTLVNAYDLVRIHKFGDLDSEAKDGTPTNKLPSSKAMNEFVSDLPEIRDYLLAEALGDFDEELPVEDDRSWLEIDSKGEPEVNSYLLAQQILKEIPIYWDGLEFLRYDAEKGIWLPNAEEYIRSYISTKKLGKITKIRHLNETVVAIRAQAFSSDVFAESDLDKIVLANGVYDLKQDTFKGKFDPELHARSSHPIEYNPEATCDTFEGFLKETVGAENIDFIYEWFGYNFYREYTIQKMLFIYGSGGTGKSTIINILREMIGADNYSAVTLQYLMQERFAKIGLYRKTANFDTDAKPQYLADGATLKMLTGEDTIHADRKNKEPINFYNYAKLSFAMNELPPMRDFSGGLKRRMMILEMNKVLSKEIKLKYPLDKIMGELPGIFNKSMEGLKQALARKDFSISSSMRASVERWEKGNDVVAMFLEDECELGEDLKAPVADVYPAYKFYCQDSGYKPLARNSFNQRMRELGYENKNIKSGKNQAKNWIGFQLKGDF
ncbi:phage/plasmid primase, P4 family [Streptococcus pluranimalium]|uniref:DNA primase family protein n=1 Tax=Streptococcus pluranimalium TaxID=82348 RepID=UPI003F690C57